MELEKILTYLNTPNEIVLFKQALFCKAYEESAWQFCTLIKPYKPVKHYIKKVKKEIVSTGFPVSILENILNVAKEKGFTIHTDNEAIIRINTNGGCEGSFEEWKSNIQLHEPIQKNVVTDATNTLIDKKKEAVIEKLKGYAVANHTPIETMQLVMELQKELAVFTPE